MGLRNETKTGNYIKIITDEKTGYPNFCLMVNKVPTNPSNVFEGTMKYIAISGYVWEGKHVDTVEIILGDGGENYQLEMGFTPVCRSILNSLAGCNMIGDVVMKVYLGKANENGKRYPKAYVEVDGKQASWKYQPADVPKMEVIKNGKGEFLAYDDAEINEFFKRMIVEDIEPKIKDVEMVKREMGGVPADVPENFNTEVDNLPF